MSGYQPPPDEGETWTQGIKDPRGETTWERLTKKFKEEPLVPLGIAATVFALGGATSALQKGNRTQFNKFLRYRVAAQGLTIVAALGGSVYYSNQRRAVRLEERQARLDQAAQSSDQPPAST
ncbi:hypothetical protein T439DRAFT_324305 [Meredithblackwellia eburnea MCA 4105]